MHKTIDLKTIFCLSPRSKTNIEGKPQYNRSADRQAVPATLKSPALSESKKCGF